MQANILAVNHVLPCLSAPPTRSQAFPVDATPALPKSELPGQQRLQSLDLVAEQASLFYMHHLPIAKDKTIVFGSLPEQVLLPTTINGD